MKFALLSITLCLAISIQSSDGQMPIRPIPERVSLADRVNQMSTRRHALAMLINQRQFERHNQMVNRAHQRHLAVSQRLAEQHQRRLNAWADRHENLHQEINERHLRRVNRTTIRGSRDNVEPIRPESLIAADLLLDDRNQALPEVSQLLDQTVNQHDNLHHHHQQQQQQQQLEQLHYEVRSEHARKRRQARESIEKYPSGSNQDEMSGVKFLKQHEQQALKVCRDVSLANWDYTTNLTEHNKQRLLNVTLEYARFDIEAWKNATSFAWKNFKDPIIRRWFKNLAVLGNAALPEKKLVELNSLVADMKDVYSKATICPYQRDGKKVPDSECKLELEPDLTSLLTESKDYDELKYVWSEWRKNSGRKIRSKFVRYVELMNESARRNGFADAGDLWREPYEQDDFEKQVNDIWEQLKPFYQLLHSYVRKRLRQVYGSDRILADGPIPAHILGNMWAQNWANGMQDILLPFPNRSKVDVTDAMKAKKMTAVDIFKLSESFFTSIGQKAMTNEFWKNSILEKPTDRSIVCHASAWDMCDGKDFRIKQCTDITMEDLIVAHHEMGHIQYYQQYALQPFVFRNGANPGFHEAVGDAIALSVSTPSHLRKIGLLSEKSKSNSSCSCKNQEKSNLTDEQKDDLNYLMSIALQKIVFLPFGYLIDLWRWQVFSGSIKSNELNLKWWENRLKYQGVCPPVRRTENDFDPGAKFHIPASSPYMSYFVSHVVQFQFHKVMCEISGHKGALHTCDIYGSKKAGKQFAQMLELGSSEPWQVAMHQLTGGLTNKMEIGPILDYFEPLRKWLENEVKGEKIGWNSKDPMLCPNH